MKPLDVVRPQRRAPEIQAGSGRAQHIVLEAAEELVLPPITSLPRDHPAWGQDVSLLSDRATSLLAGFTSVVIRVLGFWDQSVRVLRLGDQRVMIDASGSYRLE